MSVKEVVSFSLSHYRRHNEERDNLGDLSSIVCKDIIREPVIQETCEIAGEPSIITCLGVRGVWQPQTQALFDVRVMKQKNITMQLQCNTR